MKRVISKYVIVEAFDTHPDQSYVTYAAIEIVNQSLSGVPIACLAMASTCAFVTAAIELASKMNAGLIPGTTDGLYIPQRSVSVSTAFSGNVIFFDDNCLIENLYCPNSKTQRYPEENAKFIVANLDIGQLVHDYHIEVTETDPVFTVCTKKEFMIELRAGVTNCPLEVYTTGFNYSEFADTIIAGPIYEFNSGLLGD